MKKRELFDMMEEIDAELLERSEKGAEPRKVWMRWTALAACFCITAVIAVGVCVPFIRNLRAQSNPGETTAKQMYPPTEDPENDPDRLPSVPVLKGNDKVSEKTELSIGGENSSSNSGSAATVMPAFYIRTVVEAEVIEVLPDEYYSLYRKVENKGYRRRQRLTRGDISLLFILRQRCV